MCRSFQPGNGIAIALQDDAPDQVGPEDLRPDGSQPFQHLVVGITVIVAAAQNMTA